MNKTNNPSQTANLFAEEYTNKGYKLDFSPESLLNEVDKILEDNIHLQSEEKDVFTAKLTAYFGESICKIHQAKWHGEYYGPPKPNCAKNYYTCMVKIGESILSPSHFFDYYYSNGKEAEGSFHNYLLERGLITNKHTK